MSRLNRFCRSNSSKWLSIISSALVLGACGGGDGSSTNGLSVSSASSSSSSSTSTSSSSSSSSVSSIGSVTLNVTQVYTGVSFTTPVLALQAPGDASRWFVVEQGGTVRVFNNSSNVSTSSVFANLTSLVSAGGETGLLSMAFHPNYPADPRVYFWYTAMNAGQLVTQLTVIPLVSGATTLNPANASVLLNINQPESNHDGGHLAFGPDGFLYLGLGDGGGEGDVHGTIGNAQNLNTLLGKMIRINVDPGVTPYGIPAGNPFAANPKCNVIGTGSSPCPEIIAWGVRNPWRYSFDVADGSLWIGDVGQDQWEEIDHLAAIPATGFAGYNLGWRCREGAHDYNAANCGAPTGLIEPVAEYNHAYGSAVTGGYVYRGTAIPALVGRYIFGDFGSGNLWNIATSTTPTLDVMTAGALPTGLNISSFAQDMNGELYIVDYGGGGLWHITAAP